MSKDWVCQQSGDCCRHAGGVVMTPGEWDAVRAVDAREVLVTETGDGRVQIWHPNGGAACPFYEDRCTVYPVRPGVCRAYGCFRRAGEAFHVERMRERIAASAGVRRLAIRMLEEGERWTESHGSVGD